MNGKPILLARKAAELEAKFSSIERELETWKSLTGENQPLEKHHRQVLRVTKAIEGMIGVVRDEVAAVRQVEDRDPFLQLAVRAEYLILEVHRAWNYFREKLAARQGEPYGPLLEALDEVVWWCFHPAFPGEPPEPPLTFLSGDWIPAASTPMETLPLPPTTDTRLGRFAEHPGLVAERLDRLVIPVIRLPWFDASFLPEAVLLAHETGHLVSWRHELGKAFPDWLSAARTSDGRRVDARWSAWAEEVFADLYGVICFGPAFAGALMMRLLDPVDETLSGAAAYPPADLRMRVVLRALVRHEFAEQATELEAAWNELYGPPDPNEGGAGDKREIEAVIAALVASPHPNLGNKRVEDIVALRWTAQHQTDAGSTATRLIQPQTFLPTQARVALAGTQVAFFRANRWDFGPDQSATANEEPQELPAERVVEHILANREPGVRNRSTVLANLPSPESLEDKDRDRGAALARDILANFDAASSGRPPLAGGGQ